MNRGTRSKGRRIRSSERGEVRGREVGEVEFGEGRGNSNRNSNFFCPNLFIQMNLTRFLSFNVLRMIEG